MERTPRSRTERAPYRAEWSLAYLEGPGRRRVRTSGESQKHAAQHNPSFPAMVYAVMLEFGLQTSRDPCTLSRVGGALIDKSALT